MLVIPAVDIRGGYCVRLEQGKLTQETVFSSNPVKVAKGWEAQGARLLHVVDLDGAFLGRPCNLDIVKEIVKAIDIPVQLGGGIRDIGSIQQILDLGVKRVVIGTMAISAPDLAKDIFKHYGGQVILALDCIDGLVAVKGWQEKTNQPAVVFAKRMETLGAARIIFTDIQRDGMLAGPNIEFIEQLVKTVNIPIIASGGISNLGDIQKLKKSGVEGVILGKALYVGAIDFKEAIEVAS